MIGKQVNCPQKCGAVGSFCPVIRIKDLLIGTWKRKCLRNVVLPIFPVGIEQLQVAHP